MLLIEQFRRVLSYYKLDNMKSLLSCRVLVSGTLGKVRKNLKPIPDIQPCYCLEAKQFHASTCKGAQMHH